MSFSSPATINGPSRSSQHNLSPERDSSPAPTFDDASSASADSPCQCTCDRTSHSVPCAKKTATGTIPPVRVNLFGGFEVFREEVPVNDELLGRYKIRTLLSILVLSGTKELSCQHMGNLLWPMGSEERNRHNFYNVWSILRQALQLPNGHCPYLIRHQNTCRVVADLVKSDVHELTALCTELQFGTCSRIQILKIYRRIRELYTGELLPGEKESSVIIRKRWEWRDKVANALIAAANCLFEQQDYQSAVWLAQAASVVDPSREDACQIKMRSYVALGAKASALQAFHELRHYLSEELALNPSSATTKLFNAIISESGGEDERITDSQHFLMSGPVRHEILLADPDGSWELPRSSYGFPS